MKPAASKEEWRAKLLACEFSELGWDRKRVRIFIEQDHSCGRCSISEWLGQPLTLEVDHIDGDTNNNSRENLIALCPNCHSQTPTWRGRNTSRPRKVSDHDLIEAIRTQPTLRQALISVGMQGRGANYKRATRLAARLMEGDGGVEPLAEELKVPC